MAETAVSAALALVVKVAEALENVQANKKTCRRLAEQWRRLQHNLPQLRNASNFGQSHRSALEALEQLGKRTTAFIAKFDDRGFFKKHWNHEADKKEFRELGEQLDSLIQELQLGILTDTRLFLQNLDRDHDKDLEDIQQQLEGLGAGQGQILEGQAHLAHMLQLVQEQMSRVMHMQPSGGAMNTVQNEIRGVCGACHKSVFNTQDREKDTATGVYRHRDPKDCHVLAAALREQQEREREAVAPSVPTPARTAIHCAAVSGSSSVAFLRALDINNQEDCAHLQKAGIKTTEDLMELELEDITAMEYQALSISTKKRLTRFAQLSREEKQRVLDGSSAAAATAAAEEREASPRTDRRELEDLLNAPPLPHAVEI
eukprot:Tamp_10027.p1 GENE.Tamp_10027~~Tamp_10027.p1  ORF type:complete len:373 (+),score=75.82 Tamp_10027:320-1438(+)